MFVTDRPEISQTAYTAYGKPVDCSGMGVKGMGREQDGDSGRGQQETETGDFTENGASDRSTQTVRGGLINGFRQNRD